MLVFVAVVDSPFRRGIALPERRPGIMARRAHHAERAAEPNFPALIFVMAGQPKTPSTF
jgi:hypothetical protein